MSEPTPTTSTDISGFAAERKRRSTMRAIVLLVLLFLILAFAAWSALYYRANRQFPLPGVVFRTGTPESPEYLYSISGPEGADILRQPMGVAVSADNRVYTVDTKNRVVRCYTADGDYLFSFNAIASEEATSLGLPARVAIGPDDNVWVTDRRLQAIFIFSPEGEFVRQFDPVSEADFAWGPLALGFADDGTVYVADVLYNRLHRVVATTSDGTLLRTWGKTTKIKTAAEAPGDFHYPNGVAVSDDGRIFVSDMNNRRIQVFTSEGEFLKILQSSGSPQGMVIDDEERLYVVDPFAHQVDIYDLEGARIIGFGGPGLAEGKFRFPSDIALGGDGRIYVSDRENNQIQVWRWPTGPLPPIDLPAEPLTWALCLSPLLLLLIPLARRRRSIVAAPDFIEGMVAAEELPAMDDRRFRWVVPNEVYAIFADRTEQGVDLGRLLDNLPYSDRDVTEMLERADIDRQTAILLVMGDRDGRLATEEPALASAARTLGIEVIDRRRFLEQYAKRRSGATNG